ncbi:MAG: ABC transporter substrate-binding protein [Dehalococcoidia bacterium]
MLTLEIPDTVQGVIRSRIDRLEEEPRKVLQIASVIGKSFLYPVLQHVATMDGRLDEHLSVLQRLELIEERARLPEVEYGFKHVLTQEVTYNGLLKGIRTEYHERVAESIESLFPDRLEEFYGMLGHHWSEAGESEKAIGFLLQAGDRARLSYSHQEAQDHYNRALEHLRKSKDDEGVAKTLFKLGLVHHISGNFERVTQCYEEAFEIWQTEGPAPTPPEQETLKLGHWVVPGLALDPGRVFSIHESKIVQQLFEGLAEHDADGNVVPAGARSWEISEGGTRYLFHLRPGLRWSDGKPVTAGDFEYAWKRNLDPATEARLASNLYPVQGARPFHQGEAGDPGGVGVSAIDDATLLVRLEAPTAYFLHLVAYTITYPLPRWAIEAHGDRWTEPGKIVTNGPFMLAEYSVGSRLVMVRNPAHPGPFPGNLGHVEWNLAADRSSDLLPLYEAGEVDVAPIPESALHLTRQAHPSHAKSFPILGTWYLRFDVGRPPFIDPQLRRSFVLAVDRDKLARIFQELPARGGLVPPGMPGHSAEVGLSRDPEQARRTLSQAGYPDGRGFPQVRLLADSGLSEMAHRLSAQWLERLGAQVEIEALGGEEREEAAASGSFHLHLMGWVADYPDPDNFLRILFHSAGAYSHVGWRSEEFDRLVDEAAQLQDQVQRLSLYQRAEQLLVADQVVAMPISHVRKDYLVKDWVRNFQVKPLYELDLRQVVIERP